MPTLKMEDSNSASAYPVLPADTIVPVTVLDVKVKDAKNKEGETWQKLEFTFEIDGVPAALEQEFGSLVGSKIWGSTGIRLTTHPDNRLRAWVEVLLAGLQLDAGFELDTDSLIGRKARAIVNNYVKRDNTTGHGVAALLPLVGGTAPTWDNSVNQPAPSGTSRGFTLDEVIVSDDPPF